MVAGVPSAIGRGGSGASAVLRSGAAGGSETEMAPKGEKI